MCPKKVRLSSYMKLCEPFEIWICFTMFIKKIMIVELIGDDDHPPGS